VDHTDHTRKGLSSRRSGLAQDWCTLLERGWNAISREERLFCSYLYFDLRRDPKPFLGLIDRADFEVVDVGFEVCLKRDVLAFIDPNRTRKGLPFIKRTFDLCLFGSREILCVEAKAHQSLRSDREQWRSFTRLRADLGAVMGLDPDAIRFFGLTSSRDTKRPRNLTEAFDKIVHWQDVARVYDRSGHADVYVRADDVFPARATP